MPKTSDKALRGVSIARQRHIFRKFRYEGVRVAAVMFLIFGVNDFIYRPELAKFWFFLRMVFVGWMLFAVKLLKKSHVRKKYSEILVVVSQVLASSFLNIMIAQSGGYQSYYLIGLMLTSLISGNIFRTTFKLGIISSVLSYLPTMAIIAYSAGVSNWFVAVLYIFYFISFIVINFVFTKDDSQKESKSLNKEVGFRNEIGKYQRTEILKKQFPENLRKLVESGQNHIMERRFLPNAVVGFADLTNSTLISNQMTLEQDWELKECFLENATKLATLSGYVVLNQMGDGFLFLANFEENNNWHQRLIGFFEVLRDELELIKEQIVPTAAREFIGIKCSASMGPCLVGFLGKGQPHFTAVGPDVNLAARLCARASRNEIVLGSRIWYIVKHSVVGYKAATEVFTDLKGFAEHISAVRLALPSKSKQIICSQCSSPMHLSKNDEGLYEIECLQGHSGDSRRREVA